MRFHVNGTSQDIEIYRCKECDDIHFGVISTDAGIAMGASLSYAEWDIIIDHVDKLRSHPELREGSVFDDLEQRLSKD